MFQYCSGLVTAISLVTAAVILLLQLLNGTNTEKPPTRNYGTQVAMERSNSSPRKKYNNIPSDKTGYSASGSSESLDSHDGKAKITRRKSCPERHHARPRLWSNISSDSDIQGINLKELTQVQPSSSAFDSLFLEDRETVVENLCDSTEHLKSVSELHSGDSSESLSCDDYVVPGEEENPQAHSESTHPTIISVHTREQGGMIITMLETRLKEWKTFSIDVVMEIHRNNWENGKLLAEKNQQIRQLMNENEKLKRELTDKESKITGSRPATTAKKKEVKQRPWIERSFLRFL